MVYSMLGYINLEFLNPIIDFLNAWYIPIMTVLATAGVLYAIILGINLAKSDSADKRQLAKKRIIHASATIIIVIVLTFSLRFVLANLDGWINHSQDNKIMDNSSITQVVATSYKNNTSDSVTVSSLSGFNTSTYKNDENNNYTNAYVIRGLQHSASTIKVTLKLDSKYSIYEGGYQKESDGKNEYSKEISMNSFSQGFFEEVGVENKTQNKYFKYYSFKVTIMNGNITVGYYDILLVTDTYTD